MKVYLTYKNHKLYNTKKQQQYLFTCRSLMGEWKSGYIPDKDFGRLRVGPPDVGEDFNYRRNLCQ